MCERSFVGGRASVSCGLGAARWFREGGSGARGHQDFVDTLCFSAFLASIPFPNILSKKTPEHARNCCLLI